MNRKRLIILGVVLLVPAIILAFLNFQGTGDDSRVQLDTVFNNNQQLVDLGKEAAVNASIYGLKVVASDLAATSASDNQLLSKYYEERYGKEPKKRKLAKEDNPVEKLKTTEKGSGFDRQYKEFATSRLEENLSIMSTLFDATKNQELRELLSTIYDNQAKGLEKLKAAP